MAVYILNKNEKARQEEKQINQLGGRSQVKKFTYGRMITKIINSEIIKKISLLIIVILLIAAFISFFGGIAVSVDFAGTGLKILMAAFIFIIVFNVAVMLLQKKAVSLSPDIKQMADSYEVEKLEIKSVTGTLSLLYGMLLRLLEVRIISRLISVLCIITVAALFSGCEKNAGNSSENITNEHINTTVSEVSDSDKSDTTVSVTPGNVLDAYIQMDKTGWTEIDIFEGIEYYSFSDSEEYRTISESNENTLYPVTVYPELRNNPYWKQYCDDYLTDEQKNMACQTGSTGTAGYFYDGVTEMKTEEIQCFDVLHFSDYSDHYISLPVTESLTFTVSFKPDDHFAEYLEDNHYVIRDTEKTFTVNTDEFETVKKCAEESILRSDNHETELLTDFIFGGKHNLTGNENYLALTGYEAAETYRKNFTENEFRLYPDFSSAFKWDWCQEFIMAVKDNTARLYYPVRVIKIRNNSTVVWAADYPFNDIVFTPEDWDSCSEDDVNEFFKDELLIRLGEWVWSD